MRMNTSTRILISSAVAAWAFASSLAAQEIKIFSESSNPNNPIRIQSPAQPVPKPQAVSSSALDQVQPLSSSELATMEGIFKVIEETNTIKNIQADDPLSGMSPDQRAFFEAMQSIMPMTPEQVRMFKQRYETTKRASHEPMRQDAQRLSRSVQLTLKPGEESPVIKMQPGKVATVTFSDMNGQPWPILTVTTGDSNAFNAQTAGEAGKSNILVVNPKMEYALSNMVITLVDNPVPIIMTLDGRADNAIDYRTDIQIADKGPNSQYAVSSSYNLPPTMDKVMMAFLDGLPPKGARKKLTSSGQVEAYSYEGQMFVRTRGDVLSPAYMSKSTNVSGVSVFVMEEAPVILVSINGVMNSISINNQ